MAGHSRWAKVKHFKGGIDAKRGKIFSKLGREINDQRLQDAANAGDAVRVTQFIERGVLHSTHIMCLVSASTVKSWWVPYELGFGKRSGKPLSTLKLKGEVYSGPQNSGQTIS